MRLVAQIAQTVPGGSDRRDDGPRGVGPAVTGAEGSAGTIAAEDLPESTDEAIVRAAVGGQREAFSELVRRYTKMVFWFVSGHVSDPLEAEEIVQEAMVRAYVDLPRLRAPRAFGSWLLAVAGHVLCEKRRMDSKRPVLEVSEDAAGPAEMKSPSEELSDAELCSMLTEEMLKLPAHYRMVLALRYMNGCSLEQIAERLQIPAGTVRSRLSRACGVLRRRLAPVICGAGAEPAGTNGAGGGTKEVRR